MNHTLSPIIVFTYKRLVTLKRTVEALKKCELAHQSDLFFFSDGYKNESDKELVIAVRNYLTTVNGFKSIQISYSDKNRGLAESIISGVTKVFETHKSAIVLEDDILTSRNFLLYMNQCVNWYQGNPAVFSISGYTLPIRPSTTYPYDIYFFPRACSQAWATWKDRWLTIDWEMLDFPQFATNSKQRKAFNYAGSDMYRMLKRQKEGKIDSWAIRWCYHQFKIKGQTVYPILSKVQNIGYDVGASNSNVYNRYFSLLDQELKSNFHLPKNIFLDENLISQFQNYYSLKTRIIGRLQTYAYKLGLLKNR